MNDDLEDRLLEGRLDRRIVFDDQGTPILEDSYVLTNRCGNELNARTDIFDEAYRGNAKRRDGMSSVWGRWLEMNSETSSF